MSQNPYKPSQVRAERDPSASQVPESAIATRLFAVGQFVVGACAGFFIWIWTAPREAWDANAFYSVAVFQAGAMSSLFRLRGCWWGVLGVYLGQFAGLSLLVPHTTAPIFPARIGVLLCGTIQAAAGAAIGGAAGYCFWRLHRALTAPR